MTIAEYNETWWDGWRMGQTDWKLEQKNSYSWHSANDYPGTFTRAYGEGYRAGWENRLPQGVRNDHQ